jgi:hypothetical protein
MRFDWKPESKERYFRKAEAAVKAAGFDDILRVDRDQFSVVKGTVKVHFRNGGAGQMKMREVAERFRHMLKVKDCRHLCLTCEYYEICKREVNADEYEIRNEK